MNKIKRLLPFLLFSVAVAVVAIGCVSANPDYPANSPDPYRVSPDLTNAATAIRGVHEATKPINPYSPLSGPVVEYGLGIAAAVAAYLAKRKNDEAKRQTAAADSLAETIARLGQPATTEALKTAGANNIIETVAKHIDNNSTPPA